MVSHYGLTDDYGLCLLRVLEALFPQSSGLGKVGVGCCSSVDFLVSINQSSLFLSELLNDSQCKSDLLVLGSSFCKCTSEEERKGFIDALVVFLSSLDSLAKDKLVLDTCFFFPFVEEDSVFRCTRIVNAVKLGIRLDMFLGSSRYEWCRTVFDVDFQVQHERTFFCNYTPDEYQMLAGLEVVLRVYERRCKTFDLAMSFLKSHG